MEVSFLKRALIFQGELQRQRFPNSSSLAQLCDCSRSTAVRTIERLRDEFGVPLEYDESERGYYLTDPNFSFASLPLGRDELVALVLLSELSGMIDDAALQGALNSLWARVTNGRSDVVYDLEQARSRFSSDSTSIAKLADIDLVRLLGLCQRAQPVRITYRSPWRHEADRVYLGIFRHLHFSDGILYAMFEEHLGRQIVLNVSFMKEIAEIQEVPASTAQAGRSSFPRHYWLEGFGVWSGTKPQLIEVSIAAPASRYYAAQSWHADQEDRWDGEVLVRSFPGIPSPELLRRILSLGRYVVAVKPESVLEQLHADVQHLSNLCTALRGGPRS
jgi:predicted DNA-binding transcriptional regulator YafY